MKKKRHHYILKSYLRFFCNDSGQVRVYRKEVLLLTEWVISA